MAKNKTIKVYVSDDEFNFINEKAKKCNTEGKEVQTMV